MYAATIVSPITTGGNSHAVSRSAELLSCARTAVKIAKQQHPTEEEGWWCIHPAHLSLSEVHTAPNHDVLEDGLSLLRTMDAELKQLEGLVRRRGQTNDPTDEIAQSVHRLETDAKELTDLIQRMMPLHARGQNQRHWQMLQQWFQSTAQYQATRLKEILKIRATVLAEQELRRKRFQYKPAGASSSTGGGSIGKSSAAKNLAAYNSPLFMNSPVRPLKNGQKGSAADGTKGPSTLTSNANDPVPQQNGTSTQQDRARSDSTQPSSNVDHGPKYYSSSSSYYGGVGRTTPGYGGGGGGYGGGGYGSNSSYYQGPNHATGMRQRRGMQHDMQQQQHDQQELLLQQRLQQRQTNQRLQEARQAERSLAELGTLFGKMSSLITQQSEVIDKVEDDVEAAFVDVSAGQQEIAVLHALKKGNRALIIKVFGLLIFFIIFMRVYKGK